MKIVPADESKVLKNYKRCKNQKILEEFVDSGLKCVEVLGWKQKNAYQCAASFNRSIKRFKLYNIQAISTNGRVYLIHTDFAKNTATIMKGVE